MRANLHFLSFLALSPTIYSLSSDRETFSDSHTASPASQQAFVNQFAYTPGYENDLVYPPGDLESGMNGFSDMPYNCGNSLPDVYRDLPGVRGTCI